MSQLLPMTREQARRIDAAAVSRFGLSGLVLMENAGRGVVDVLLSVDPTLATPTSPLAGPPQGAEPEGVDLPLGVEVYEKPRAAVAIFCGKGNNAGDGFVIARHLAIRGVESKVLLLMPPDELTGDALVNYQILEHTGASIADLSTFDFPSLSAALDRHAGGATWLVDALLGTGAQGEPRQPLAAAIAWMNASRAKRLAVDLPSGLDCDSGMAATHTVRADVTCTFVAAKAGFAAQVARQFLGEVFVVPIGLTAEMVRLALTVQ